MSYSGELSEAQAASLKEELRQNLYVNTAQVATFIRQRFGLRYSLSGVVKLLHRQGFVYKKTKTVPANGDLIQQQAFIGELQDLLQTTDGEQAVYFDDAVHPQHNTRANYGCIVAGDEFAVPANNGRKKVNLNGALNAHEVTDIVIQG